MFFIQVWNLITGNTYQFRVRAENRYGKSDACESEEVLIKDPFGLPGPPEKPTIAEYSKTSMVVTWEPPLDNGGSLISGYWLEKREKGSSYWARVNKSPVTKRGLKGWEFQVTRLNEGLEYEFRVMACNCSGVGPPSGPSDSAFAVDPISKWGHLYKRPTDIATEQDLYCAFKGCCLYLPGIYCVPQLLLVCRLLQWWQTRISTV